MKVGIFGSEYQIERQNLIKRLFEKLREQDLCGQPFLYIPYRCFWF